MTVNMLLHSEAYQLARVCSRRLYLMCFHSVPTDLPLIFSVLQKGTLEEERLELPLQRLKRWAAAFHIRGYPRCRKAPFQQAATSSRRTDSADTDMCVSIFAGLELLGLSMSRLRANSGLAKAFATALIHSLNRLTATSAPCSVRI